MEDWEYFKINPQYSFLYLNASGPQVLSEEGRYFSVDCLELLLILSTVSL